MRAAAGASWRRRRRWKRQSRTRRRRRARARRHQPRPRPLRPQWPPTPSPPAPRPECASPSAPRPRESPPRISRKEEEERRGGGRTGSGTTAASRACWAPRGKRGCGCSEVSRFTPFYSQERAPSLSLVNKIKSTCVPFLSLSCRFPQQECGTASFTKATRGPSSLSSSSPFSSTSSISLLFHAPLAAEHSLQYHFPFGGSVMPTHS